jgi:hypothetical protein
MVVTKVKFNSIGVYSSDSNSLTFLLLESDPTWAESTSVAPRVLTSSPVQEVVDALTAENPIGRLRSKRNTTVTFPANHGANAYSIIDSVHEVWSYYSLACTQAPRSLSMHTRETFIEQDQGAYRYKAMIVLDTMVTYYHLPPWLTSLESLMVEF